jgi:predicted porin
MKKNIVALAVAAAISAPVAMADAPTVYGQINVNAAFVDGSDVNMNDTASRIGVKGSEDLGNGLKAVYKMEFGVDVDTTGSSQFSGRNQYLGLAGGFGTVLIGSHDTPEKMSQASDLFNDGAADLGKGNMTDTVNVNEIRSGDVLAYVSPSFSGVKLIAAAVRNGNDDNGANSAAITYGSAKKGLYLAAAMTDFQTNGAAADTTRISAQYKANGLTANVIFMNATDAASDADNGTVTQVNLGYKMGKFMPKVKMSMADSKAASSTTNMAYGLNYSLGKKTTAYVYMVDADKDNSAGTDSSYIGMVHKF